MPCGNFGIGRPVGYCKRLHVKEIENGKGVRFMPHPFYCFEPFFKTMTHTSPGQLNRNVSGGRSVGENRSKMPVFEHGEEGGLMGPHLLFFE